NARPRALGGHRGAGPDERDLQRIRPVEPGPAERSLDAPEVRAPPDQLGVGRRAMRVAPGEQDDRLEEAGLAGRVRAPDELRP
ncbi:MAG TPA: hypothetical protein VF484_00415, partial [Candidatus Limnocylindrales bacterium]